MRLNKTSKILGLGVIGACGVCCAPLILPVVIALGGLGMYWGGFLVIGLGVVGLAILLWFRRHRRNCDCC